MSLLWGKRPAAVEPEPESRALSFQSVFGTGGDITTYGPLSNLSLVPLFAAHRTIIDTVASTPLHGYRQLPDGTSVRLARDPKVIEPLVGTGYQWKAQIVASLLYDGNAFGVPVGLDAGWPAGIMWVNPLLVDVDDSAGTGVPPVYYFEGRKIDGSQILHIPWIVPPGRWRGLSPLKAFKVAFETGHAAQRQARDWYAGGAIPPAHLKNTARTLSSEQSDEAKGKYMAAIEGRQPLVTGMDWDLTTIGIPADEQRFIETIKLTAGQTAAIYGLEPEDVGGEAANSLTYATVEGNERKRAQRVARPWCQRIEEALTGWTPRPQYLKFNLDANVRADLKTRMESHEIAMRIGLETEDEARAIEDKPPMTEDERARWLSTWQPNAMQGPKQIAELVQKIYLGVGKVLTVGEARDLLRSAGYDLTDAAAAEIFADLPPLPAQPPKELPA